MFQSTPSQRGRPGSEPRSIYCVLFQSTPSQRGRHDAIGKHILKGQVSIHALAKRATGERHAGGGYHRRFNPRPRKEGDLIQ